MGGEKRVPFDLVSGGGSFLRAGFKSLQTADNIVDVVVGLFEHKAGHECFEELRDLSILDVDFGFFGRRVDQRRVALRVFLASQVLCCHFFFQFFFLPSRLSKPFRNRI